METKNLENKWFAVYTRHKFEKKISLAIRDKGIETYCPVKKVERQWSDRRKVIEAPLFTSYVFVRCTPAEQSKIREVDGVINFVYWLGKPAVIKDHEIDTIKMFLNEYENVHIEKLDLSINDRVRIKGGPLLFNEGVIHEVKNRTVKVYLPSLGFQMLALVEKTNIELIRQQA